MIAKRSFLHQNRPLNTCMIQTPDIQRAICIARNAAYDGCDAYGFQMEQLPKEKRTYENLHAVFSAMDGKPIYVTNYRGNQNSEDTDEELFRGLQFLLQCGAVLVDIMGDLYAPHPMQLTENPDAIEKQKASIAKIHEAGGEVLMSSHVLRFTSAEEVLRIAGEHEARGADISKIVTAADSIEEEMENLRITTLLQKELHIPFLFLSGGSHCQIHRQIGPMLGCIMWLTVQEHDERSTKAQPICRAVAQIKNNFSF